MTLTNPNYPRLTFLALLILAIVTCWYTFHCRNTNGVNYKQQHERLIKAENKHELDSLQKNGFLNSSKNVVILNYDVISINCR